MALIGKLRQRSGIIIGAIAVSILGFLVMDATNNQSGVLKGRSTNVGTVNGESIDYTEFMSKYEENQRNAEEQMRNQGGLTDEQRNYLRQQTWEEFVSNTILNKTYETNGIDVTDDEMVELTTGQNVHPYIRQSFSNPQTGQFEPQYVKMFIQNLDQDEKGTEPGTRRKQWNNLEKEIKKNQLNLKYNTLIAKGLTTPSWFAEAMYQDANKTADVKFLAFPYSEINEADIKYTDDDLKKYLDQNAARYDQKEESRKIQYVSFDILPSSEDSALALNSLNEKLEDFRKGEKSGDDSLFVKIYSESAFNNFYFTKDELAASPVVDDLFAQPVKTVIGPYIEGEMYKYAKIINKKALSDSVRVREIIFSFENVKTQEEAQLKRKLYDSVFTEIDSLKKDFGMMAAMFSDDQNSKMRGGDRGWIKFGQNEQVYNAAVFYFASKGEVIKTYTQNALHIVQILEDRPSKPAVQVAYFTKTILPTPETERAIYAAASKFASDNSSEAKFVKAAKANPNARTIEYVGKNDFSIVGVNNARELVRWAFNAKKGEVSSIIGAEKKHIIAYLEAIREKGTPELDAVKDQVKIAFIKDKKFELIAKKIEAASAKSIEELASKNGKEVAFAERASFSNPVLGNVGYEPNVAAAAVYSTTNKLSAPIKGNMGAYVVEKVSGIDPPKATDLAAYQYQGRQMAGAKAGRGALEALKKSAKIKDNRFDFF
jgi:peptidyl-prolyl cis-trans isomerase D